MTRYDLARLVGAVFGLVDSVYSGDAQCVVAKVPTLAPSFFDEGCPLCVDAITKKNAVAVVNGLAQSVALCYSQRVVLGDGARYLLWGGAATQDHTKKHKYNKSIHN